MAKDPKEFYLDQIKAELAHLTLELERIEDQGRTDFFLRKKIEDLQLRIVNMQKFLTELKS